jgi:hypothetical protein
MKKLWTANTSDERTAGQTEIRMLQIIIYPLIFGDMNKNREREEVTYVRLSQNTLTS